MSSDNPQDPTSGTPSASSSSTGKAAITPPARTDNFLYVPVKKGGSRQDLLDAVQRALTVHAPLPTFKDHHNPPAPAGAAADRSSASGSGSHPPPPPPPPSGSPGSGGGLGPDEGLLIFCKVEGGNG